MGARDLDNRQEIERFVDAFYAKVLIDPTLAPIFLDVAAIDLSQHLPHIKNYWAKLLLGESDYRRHTMNIHRELHGKRPLVSGDFQRWLQLFRSTVDDSYRGPGAERAKRIAATIARNMEKAVN